MRSVYMDYAATTPLDPRVLEAMMPYLTNVFGNPSSVHAFGREARKAVSHARLQVATALGCTANEIIFTSGGTEADNLALFGVADMYGGHRGKQIISSPLEHHAIADSLNVLEKRGFTITYLPVDENGLIDPKDVENAISSDTLLVSIIHGNNEIGTIQPAAEIGRICRAHNVLYHLDAVQTAGQIPLNVEELGCDLLSLAAHKFYGPKGVGALYMRRGVRVAAQQHGGVQERNVRAGTENVPGLVGMGCALELAEAEREARSAKEMQLRDRLIAGLLAIPDVKLNGHPTMRLPNNVNVSILWIEGESTLLALDLVGIAASSGSACTSGSLDPSHVLMGIGLDHTTAHGSLRLTLGRDTTEEEVDYVLTELPPIVERLRSMSPIWPGNH